MAKKDAKEKEKVADDGKPFDPKQMVRTLRNSLNKSG